MKAIILAAGRGSRMKHLTDELPKCLVKLQGKSLLDIQLDCLRKAGISEIGIVTGYKSELLKKYNLVEFHNPRWSETNMVSSLICADEWLQNETCIVSYSDIFYQQSAIKLLIENRTSLALTYDPNWLSLWSKRFNNPLDDAETFQMNRDNTLLNIGNKPGSIDEIEGQYMGLLRFTPKSWSQLLRLYRGLSLLDRDQLQMTSILQMIISDKTTPVTAIKYEGVWGEIDSEGDLIVAEKSISSV